MQADDELLEAWRAGSTSAGRELLERYFEPLYRFFVTKAPEAAEDLIQQTLTDCTGERDRFRGACSFRTFVYTLARHRLIAHRRARRRTDVRATVQATVWREPPVSPSSAVDAKHQRKLLATALREIPLDLQIALELYYWEDMSASEIAEVLGIPEGTVRSRLRRGRAVLEGYLDELVKQRKQLATTSDVPEAWAARLRQWMKSDPPGKNR